MRGACIDIGSNTTRLLVAELRGDELCEVLCERASTPVAGAGRVERLVAIVAEHLDLARESGAEELRVIGTAVLRDAPDGAAICAAIEGALAVPVEVLSSAEEARLTFVGAMRTAGDVPRGSIAVVDVGGGSVEVVCGSRSGGADWSVSLPIGSATLTARHVGHDPPTRDELDRMRAEIQGAFATIAPPRVEAAYAVAGPTMSLRGLTGTVLDPAALERGLAAVGAQPSAEIARSFGLVPERVRVLSAGFLLLEAAGSVLGRPLSVVRGGLREGVIWERLGATSDAPEKDTHIPGGSSG